jgi:hypothetical protein
MIHIIIIIDSLSKNLELEEILWGFLFYRYGQSRSREFLLTGRYVSLPFPGNAQEYRVRVGTVESTVGRLADHRMTEYEG